MKKLFLIGFTLLQCISFNVQADRYDDIAIHHQETYPNSSYTYVTLTNIEKNNNAENTCLVITDEDLKNHKNQIETYLLDNPEAFLLLDIEENNNFVRQNTLLMYKSNLPACCSKLIISNLKEDIYIVDNDFLKNCDTLAHFFLDLPKVTTINSCFLYRCENITELSINTPMLKQLNIIFFSLVQVSLNFHLIYPDLQQ
jgi:hypothetical protein